jgi:hypothetical protein
MFSVFELKFEVQFFEPIDVDQVLGIAVDAVMFDQAT